jgi:hypothetical protein
MLSLHDQGRGPWILLHVVPGPWTSFVDVHDKGQCKIAVCGRHTLFIVYFFFLLYIGECKLNIPLGSLYGPRHRFFAVLRAFIGVLAEPRFDLGTA